MKRGFDHATVAVQPQLLPDDILVHLARIGEWLLSGSVARCNKSLLRRFTTLEILGEIVHAIVASERVILKWLLLALPDTLIGTRTVYKPSDTVVGLELDHPGGFISGGAVCRMVYDKQWDSDVDVWVHCDSEADAGRKALMRVTSWCSADDDSQSSSAPTPLKMVQFDVVYHTRPEPERCIENFDLSIVQQGYFQGERNEVYSTPLALYSRQHNHIVALPSRECIEYNDGSGRTRLVDIWYYIDKHRANHRNDENELVAYHECKQCDDDGSSGHEPFQRWRARMKTYASRFTGFPITYCRTQPDTVNVYTEKEESQEEVRPESHAIRQFNEAIRTLLDRLSK